MTSCRDTRWYKVVDMGCAHSHRTGFVLDEVRIRTQAPELYFENTTISRDRKKSGPIASCSCFNNERDRRRMARLECQECSIKYRKSSALLRLTIVSARTATTASQRRACMTGERVAKGCHSSASKEGSSLLLKMSASTKRRHDSDYGERGQTPHDRVVLCVQAMRLKL